ARTPPALRRAQALALAQERPGWQVVLGRFDVVDADMDPIRDDALQDGMATLRLRARRAKATSPMVEVAVPLDVLADAGRWASARAPRPGPAVDWTRASAAFDVLTRAIRAAAWIGQWKRAGGDRLVSVHIGERGGQRFVSAELLAHAGLPASGVYEIHLI